VPLDILFKGNVLDHQHTLRPMEHCMSVVHTVTKGPMMNAMEKFYIYKDTMNKNQLNDRDTVTHNAI
jgi:hypothetical protein